MIDTEGFRLNVGIILANCENRLFWARRVGHHEAWQFPQGGMDPQETPEQTLFRELEEEVGLQARHVEILGCSQRWLRYRLPPRYIRRDCTPLCIGQKQLWFFLRLVASECAVKLDSSQHPEFDRWRWVPYWYPLREVVAFKREVYRQALEEMAPLLFNRPAPAVTPTSSAPPRCLNVSSVSSQK